ncbi:F-box/kelch-repeat protein At3g06240-like [Lathyrus oleraceus]|uniref:F-box/kelch-repeat protein At3g06240-like n=1 Tax=Pisum sativum TaxID=3888 RepID=UPI0021CF231E|nr:F-box/kelch-repeat protein At3g06240-like [Pisum sativum]
MSKVFRTSNGTPNPHATINHGYSNSEKNNHTARPPTFGRDSIEFEWWKSKMCLVNQGCIPNLLGYKDFYLWNPSTGAHKQIPASPGTIAYCDNVFMLMYGFGYEPSGGDYFVVLGSYEYNGSTSIDLEIFSLRDNKWKQIGGYYLFPYISSGYGFKSGLLLNGALHWPVYSPYISNHVIIAFDLKEMTISEIALPDDLSCYYCPEESSLLIFYGVISAWNVEMDKIEIWVYRTSKNENITRT